MIFPKMPLDLITDVPTEPPGGTQRRQGPWLELLRYAHVIRYQAYASLKAEISRTYVGVLWWVLEPLLSAATMYLVFGLILAAGRPNFFAFLLIGTFTWQWFQNSVLLAATSVLNKAGVMQQVYLPKAVFPIVSLLNGTWKFFCTFLVLLVLLTFGGHGPGLPWLALPLVLAVQFLLNLAVGLPLAVWIPFFRDGTSVITALLGFLGLASGIFFRPEQVLETHAELAPFVLYNPMACLITAYRAILLDGVWPDWQALAGVSGFGIVLLGFGLLLIRRFNLTLAKASQ